MESVLGRYKNLIWLVAILFLQVLGLAVQVKRSGNDTESTRLIRIWVVDAITPFERGLVWVESSSSNLWHNYFYLRGVRAENRQLKEEIQQMRLEQVRLSEDAAQAHRLQSLLAFKEQYIAKTVAAQVIGSSGSDLSRTVYIDKGEDAGLERDMAVLTADGIVGKLLVVYPSTSQVLLINDQSSGVGVILEKSRLQGVLRGSANGEVMLERIMSDEQVSQGETVLTSGGDQIFPKGLPVGTITKVANGKDLFLNIKVKPAADLSKLEEVLVLVEKQDRAPVADDTTHRRAADILAERLPSVPDKPPADANAPAATATGAAKSPAVTAAGSANSPASSKPGASATTTPKPATTTGVPQLAKNSSSTTSDHAAPAASGTLKSSTSVKSSESKPAAKAAADSQTSMAPAKPAARSATSAQTPPKPAPASQSNASTPAQPEDNPQ
jgi:rod shape-determining protein MreC